MEPTNQPPILRVACVRAAFRSLYLQMTEYRKPLPPTSKESPATVTCPIQSTSDRHDFGLYAFTVAGWTL